MNDILKKINLCGIVPVVKIKNADNAVALANALLRGGLNTIEITMRTDAAEDAIKAISNACPEMLVGAGTVHSADQADRAVAAGAKFIVSPGFNANTVKHCQKIGVTIIPGCSTCGEMEQALALGLDTVKFFPAEAAGGAKFLKSIASPYKELKFMPTGGIDQTNMMSYLSLSNVTACGGSFMVKESLIDNSNFDEIERLTREAVKTMLGLEIKHIGINCGDRGEAEDTASKLCSLFGTEPDVHSGAIFAGSLFEVMFAPYLGKNGHVAIGTSFPDRARAHLEALGFEFDESTAKYADNGKLKVVYAKGEIGGFAFHLLQK